MTIEERASISCTRNGVLIHNEYEWYISGATEQHKIDYWKARKAFCRATCLGMEKCPLKEDNIESGALAVDCAKLELFVKELEEQI